MNFIHNNAALLWCKLVYTYCGLLTSNSQLWFYAEICWLSYGVYQTSIIVKCTDFKFY